MIAQITAAISAIIAVISLIVSIKVYRRDTPRLRIEILHPKYDCFFGIAVVERNEELKRHRISGLRIQLRNSSSANIEVQSIQLKIKNELFRIVPNDNLYWDSATFVTEGQSEQKIDFNYSINYNDSGIHLPCAVKGYSCVEGYVLFYHFPANIRDKTTAQLIVQTAVGVVNKRVTLREYNQTFEKQEMKDVDQYYRSLGSKQS